MLTHTDNSHQFIKENSSSNFSMAKYDIFLTWISYCMWAWK